MSQHLSTIKNLKVGIRGDPAELQHILDDPCVQYIKTVFVGAPPEIGNTGRLRTYPTTIDSLKKITEVCHRHAIETNVVLNAWDITDNPFDPVKERKIKTFIQDLEKISVDWITLSSPIWITWAADIRRTIKIDLSLYAEVTSPLLAKEFLSMGVNRITLPQQINKNISLIQRIKDYAQAPLTLFVNSKCVSGGFCPYSIAHRSYKSTKTLVPQDQWKTFDDPLITRFCKPHHKSHPVDVFFSPTIRPEDLHLYEAVGVDCFKIASREASPEKTIQLVKAYGERSFHGPIGELWTVTPDKNTPPNKFFDGIFEKVMDLPEEKQYDYYVKISESYYQSHE
jgi:collagenase-like PrtC family protease